MKVKFLLFLFCLLCCNVSFGGHFVFNGVRYNSIKEWRNSSEYSNMVLEREANYVIDSFENKFYTSISQRNADYVLRGYNKDRTSYGLYKHKY